MQILRIICVFVFLNNLRYFIVKILFRIDKKTADSRQGVQRGSMNRRRCLGVNQHCTRFALSKAALEKTQLEEEEGEEGGGEEWEVEVGAGASMQN